MTCYAHTLQDHPISPSERVSFSLLVERGAGRWSALFPASHGQWAIGLETRLRPPDPKPSTKSPWPNGASLNQDVKGQPQRSHTLTATPKVKYFDSLKSVISRGSNFFVSVRITETSEWHDNNQSAQPLEPHSFDDSYLLHLG